MLAEFGRVIRASDRCAVVGESMKEAYDEQFEKDCIIVRHGVTEKLRSLEGNARRESSSYVIGYAGSITADDSFAVLIRALDNAGWQINGKSVTLRLAGVRYVLNSAQPQRIEYLGRRSVAETVSLMAEANILYLPQPFVEELRELASLSFPTKLSTYLASARPVILHAPEYAAVVPFIKRFPFGRWCDSLDAGQLWAHITSLLADPQECVRCIRAGQDAVATELNANVFLDRFREFAGLKAGRDNATSVGTCESMDRNSCIEVTP